MRRYRWVVLAVGVLGTMVTGALRQGMPALGPAFRDGFGLSLGQVGFVFGALAAGMTVALVPWGALADRLGERSVLAGGLVATAAALVLAAVSGSFALLLAALFLTGCAGASATGASGRAVMGWFARSERGFALGVRQTAIPLGGALAALTLPAVALAADLRAALLALAAFTLLAAVAGAVWMREPPPRPRTSRCSTRRRPSATLGCGGWVPVAGCSSWPRRRSSASWCCSSPTSAGCRSGAPRSCWPASRSAPR